MKLIKNKQKSLTAFVSLVLSVFWTLSDAGRVRFPNVARSLLVRFAFPIAVDFAIYSATVFEKSRRTPPHFCARFGEAKIIALVVVCACFLAGRCSIADSVALQKLASVFFPPPPLGRTAVGTRV